jgi:hypothetical protein
MEFSKLYRRRGWPTFQNTSSQKTGSLYFNNNKYFSIVLLAVADAKYRFVIVDVGAYGSSSDCGILQHSKLGSKLQSDALNIPPNECLPGVTQELPYVFVADEAFYIFCKGEPLQKI